jgi:hypothetical protein
MAGVEIYQEHWVLAELVQKYVSDFYAYSEFLYDVYFVLHPTLRLDDPDFDGLDTFDFDWKWPHELPWFEQPPGKYGVRLTHYVDLKDYALPVIEAIEVLRPNLFKSERLQEILTLIKRLHWARKSGQRSAEKQLQFEFGLAVDRYYWNLERFAVLCALQMNERAGHQKTATSADADEQRDKLDTQGDVRVTENTRKNAIRDATFLEWEAQGMTPAKIRDRWNLKNPHDVISLENASSGRDTVKKAIERERLRKTRGTNRVVPDCP